MQELVFPLFYDQYRYVGILGNLAADAAQEELGNAAETPAANDDSRAFLFLAHGQDPFGRMTHFQVEFRFALEVLQFSLAVSSTLLPIFVSSSFP